MNKKLLGIIVTAVALLAVGGVIIANRQDSQPAAGSSNRSQADDRSGSNSGGMSDSEMPMAPDGGSPDSGSNSGSGSSSGREASDSDNEVDIKNFAFEPAKLTVKKGTTVTWTNKDDARHDIMPDSPSDAFKASELLSKGESYSFTFNTVGSFSYHCSPHPYMKATVEVVE